MAQQPRLEAYMVHTTAPFVGLSTSWAKAPVDAAALGAVGGGCVLSPTRLLLWRVRGDVLTLCEETLAAPELEANRGLTVVAVCSGGDGSSLERCVVAGLRADWRLGVWLGSTGALAHSLDLRETLRGDGVAPRLGPGTRLVGVEGAGGFAVAAVLDDAPIPALALIDAGVAADGARNPAAAVVARLDAPRWRDGAPAQAAELRRGPPRRRTPRRTRPSRARARRGGDDATPFGVAARRRGDGGAALAGALAPAGGDHAYARNAPSALARGLATPRGGAKISTAAAAAAAALLGVAAGGAGEPLADASLAVARDLRVTAWLASDAPADGAAPRKARRVSFADGRDDRAHWLDRREPALAGLLAPDGQLVEGGGPGNAFLDRCAARAPLEPRRRRTRRAAGAAWSGVLGPGSPSRLDVYLRESGQPAYASLRRRRQLAAGGDAPPPLKL
ncbi:hypothetical protein JL720_8079 [Aureococcus anophagefferens]|nr:hypothetical protein JL720_8079 [Aureococcus anophagefferens]